MNLILQYNRIEERLKAKPHLKKEEEDKLLSLLDTNAFDFWGSQIFGRGSEKTTLLHLAVSKESYRLVEHICETFLPIEGIGSDHESDDDPGVFSDIDDSDDDSGLFSDIDDSDIDTSDMDDLDGDIRLYPINMTDEDGNTPLMLAVKACNLDIANLLVRYHGSIFTANRFDSCPLSWAIGCLHYEMVEMMVEEASIEPWLMKDNMKAVELLANSMQKCSSEKLQEELKGIIRKQNSSRKACTELAETAWTDIQKDCLGRAKKLLALCLNHQSISQELDSYELLFEFGKCVIRAGAPLHCK